MKTLIKRAWVKVNEKDKDDMSILNMACSVAAFAAIMGLAFYIIIWVIAFIFIDVFGPAVSNCDENNCLDKAAAHIENGYEDWRKDIETEKVRIRN